MRDVVETFDGTPHNIDRCMLGLVECNDTHPCALHEHWKGFRDNYVETIAALTLSEVLRTVVARKKPSDWSEGSRG